MRPVLLLTAATLSTPPGAPPHDSITSALEYAITHVADAVVPRVTLAPREPTIPSPPGGGAGALPPRTPVPLTFAPCRVPTGLLVEGGEQSVRTEGSSCSLVVPRRADVLAIYDAATGARAEALRASGVRLRLSAQPELRVAPRIVEEVISTLLDVAVATAVSGGRVDLVTRERNGSASLALSLFASRYSSLRATAHEDGGELLRRPDVTARLETCRDTVFLAGGTLTVEIGEVCATVLVRVPIDDDEDGSVRSTRCA
jgi:hypothetical protein